MAKRCKAKQRGKKIKVPAGNSYSVVQSERDSDMEAEEVLVSGQGGG
jgi:hypothetical protein